MIASSLKRCTTSRCTTSIGGRSRRIRQVEQHLEAVLAAQPLGRVRGVLSAARRTQRHPPLGADARQHCGARARLGRRRKGGSAVKRSGVRAAGSPASPVIPHRCAARIQPGRIQPGFFSRQLYKARARIEQAVGKIKRFKRVALRCEKTADSYSAIVAFACAIILVKSVHTT